MSKEQNKGELNTKERLINTVAVIAMLAPVNVGLAFLSAVLLEKFVHSPEDFLAWVAACTACSIVARFADLRSSTRLTKTMGLVRDMGNDPGLYENSLLMSSNPEKNQFESKKNLLFNASVVGVWSAITTVFPQGGLILAGSSFVACANNLIQDRQLRRKHSIK